MIKKMRLENQEEEEKEKEDQGQKYSRGGEGVEQVIAVTAVEV